MQLCLMVVLVQDDSVFPPPILWRGAPRILLSICFSRWTRTGNFAKAPLSGLWATGSRIDIG